MEVKNFDTRAHSDFHVMFKVCMPETLFLPCDKKERKFLCWIKLLLRPAKSKQDLVDTSTVENLHPVAVTIVGNLACM